MSVKGDKCVCVTGGSGFIGSWLVHFLLDRGYTVHATVMDLENENETKHLMAMEGAADRLKLFQMHLLDPSSVLAPIKGTVGVFHLATPLVAEKDPEDLLVKPAVEGTLNVLRAAKECGVKRVVLTSSSSAIAPNPHWPIDAVLTEESWADVDTFKKNNLWYPASKILAEKAAWDFSEKEGLDVVTICPGMVLGPVLPPKVYGSLELFIYILKGILVPNLPMDYLYMGCVDVRDVAKAMILLHENPSTKGRHLCEEAITKFSDLVNKICDLYPEYQIKRIEEDKQPWLVRSDNPSKKLIDLGLEFSPMENIIKDTVDSLKSKGFI
ncbi:hypothetical protein LUZ61_012901 [Rhynchospora tenuis]|uniref:NAD-dependent epimerase/dehydratase domain-containing protein n=1 Tax=Rhynchospora tenuis TaxID=198213 RepID=A0AAD6F1P7_9POAL|nr:hypothetical protein LUZ61_012901 [Rhynchospora tenuis]